MNALNQSFTDDLDETVRRLEQKWGSSRLRLLVDDQLRARFDEQKRRLSHALADGDEEQIAIQTQGMQRGWLALDQAAIEAGAEPGIDLATVIAETLALHAEAVEKLGTEFPEQHPDIPEELRIKMRQARINVNATLEGSDPTQHVRHLQALNKGLRIVLGRLLPPAAPGPPAPPQPVWNDSTKAWQVPVTDSKTRIAELARHFDERGPDDPNELFREEEKI